MKSTIKKVLSILIIIVVVLGWLFSFIGVGSFENLKSALKYGLDINGGVYVVMEADLSEIAEADIDSTMEQTREVLNRRVDAMGVANANVSREGVNRIRVELPGISDATSAIEKIGSTAQLRFTLADGTEYLTGTDVKSAAADMDSNNGGYKITLEFTKEGQEKFAKVTELAASGNTKALVKRADGSTVSPKAVVIFLDDDVLTAPTCDSKIDSDSCEITRSGGGLGREEALNTAALIRGGALPVSLTEVESSVQTASIGAGALDKSIIAGAIGLALVFILMIVVFNVLGIFADIALALYILIVLWVMVAMDAVLTLPGIAGIVLGIGMAVDANVIIFSRIKEEISLGRSIRVAVDQGFKRALVTVLDSQITTLIATIILYELGSTTVKGFAITLLISIIVSIFTAVIVTQLFVGMLAESRFAKNTFFGCKEDGTPKKLIKKEFGFIKHRKIFYMISAACIIIGLLFLGIKGFNYGIDFTGGTMIQMDMGQTVEIAELEDTISSFDLEPTIVYSGTQNEGIIIRTTKALSASERAEVTSAIEEKYGLDDSSVIASEQFGAVIGGELRSNAIRSILIAAVGMLLYIIFRFRSWKYGVAAVAGLGHDVLILISVYTVFRLIVNNPFIAAILTIVGYSINDTIVIFDRIRENMKLMRGKPVDQIIDHSINQTIDRTVMTSVTTLCAIIPLLIMVSSQLFVFVLPLMVGVLVGTYSSVALCSPVFYELSKKAEMSKYEQKQKARERIERKKAVRKAEDKTELPVNDEPKAQPEKTVAAEAASEAPAEVKKTVKKQTKKPGYKSSRPAGGKKKKGGKKK